MKKEYLLGIDIGTSACKAAVFDADGHALVQVAKAYKVYYPAPGWAEQDPDDWWRCVCLAIRDVLEDGRIQAGDICAVGVDGQSWSAIPVDENGNALARTPIWLDTRAEKICERVKARIGEERIFSVAGNAFNPSYTTPKMLWFKEERPDVFRKCRAFLQSNSYIVLKLTGKYSQDLSQGYGIHFFDMEKRVWDSVMAEELGLSVDLVPPLFACSQVIGEVNDTAARKTGLLQGTPVVAGGLDAACASLGAGVCRNGQTQEQGGQAGGMSICIDRPNAHRKLIISPHVVPDMWLLQGGTTGGGGAFRWFRDVFAPGCSFDQLTEEAADIAPGADGLLFLPYMAGERSPIWDPQAKGVFYGLSFDKTRGHMTRAVLEGVAFSLEHNLRTAREAGAEVGRLNAMGGAANSLLWTQIKADVTGKEIQVPGSDTATTLGAAILAGTGAGIYRSCEEGVERTVRMRRLHLPDPETHRRYQEIMESYLRLYEHMKGMFHS